MSKHVSVLLDEVLEIFAPEGNDKFLDCTFGGGGHTSAILNGGEAVSVSAFDQDPQAVERAVGFKERFGERFKFFDGNFEDIGRLENSDFKGILFDLGVSSFQLDQDTRGFSFMREAPVDMRMNPRSGRSAAEFLETADREELVEAIRNYGEEIRWRKVVDAILAARGTDALQSTLTFAALVEKALGGRKKGPAGKIHPATKTFQGIRIAVNDELGVLERVLPEAFDKLAVGGVMAIISFHSLEDRIVKRFCKKMAGRPEHGRDNRPQDERTRYAELVTRKPIIPSEQEIQNNPRSRSAKLRVIRKEREKI